MGTPDRIASERSRLAILIGTRENAETLFVPKVSDNDAQHSALLVLQRLNFTAGTNSCYSKIQLLTDSQITDWGPRIWANTVSHLARTDAEVRAILQVHQSSMPEDGSARLRLMEKVFNAFVFFLWIAASPARPLDPQNCCLLKLIILQDAILLENINALRDGKPGGWGWLNMAVAGTREIAEAFDIRRIKAVATNERIYHGFVARGFRDAPPILGFEFHVEAYARHVELTW